MAARQWTLEQRKQQAEMIMKWQPWKHSTGARTLQGKAVSSQNAFKHGMSKLFKNMRAMLKQQKELLTKL